LIIAGGTLGTLSLVKIVFLTIKYVIFSLKRNSDYLNISILNITLKLVTSDNELIFAMGGK